MSDVKRSGSTSRGGRRKRTKPEITDTPSREQAPAERDDQMLEPEASSSAPIAAEQSIAVENDVVPSAQEDDPQRQHERVDDENRREEGESEPLKGDIIDNDDDESRSEQDRQSRHVRRTREIRAERDRGSQSDRGENFDRTGREDRIDASRREGQEGRSRASDEYALMVHFDRASRSFQASFVEFPDLRSSGPQKENVIREIESKLENHLQNLRRDGKTIPEAIFSRRYPERLEVRVSQSLYRRLDVLSRQEKIGLDQLVSDLLVLAVERKSDAGRSAHERSERQERPPQRHDRQQPRHGGNQPRHSHNRRLSGRNYQETMDNRENFMEYVRSLEKGNWRKK